VTTKFEEVWNRIIALQGQTFHTIRGLPFTYKIEGKLVWIVRENRTIPLALHKNNFAGSYQTLALHRIDGPGALQEMRPTAFGTSYVWAILTDPRIK